MKITKRRSLLTLSPLFVIGAALLLVPLFLYIAYENIHIQQENASKLLREKGAALIRSFEAGTRTGMMGMRWGVPQLQRLIIETAQQPDIEYILITDNKGIVTAHNNPGLIGTTHGSGLNLEDISLRKTLNWRNINTASGISIFEVYRQFIPSQGHFPRHFSPSRSKDWSPIPNNRDTKAPQVIFVGLRMETVEAAMKEDARHTIVTVIILLLIALTGVISLFMAQGYRQAKTSLSRIKTFSDNLVETMPIGLVALDAERRITSINHAAQSILERSDRDLIGGNASELLSPHLIGPAMELEPGTRTTDREVSYPIQTGRSIPLEVISTALMSDDGSPEGTVILFRDLTEIKRLQREISRSQRLASIGSLAAGIAHEIRNPLSSIKGFATYFSERYRNVPEDRDTADIMIKEVDRLNRVITELLEFARPMHVRLQPFDLKELIDNSLKLVDKQAKDKDISITSTFDVKDAKAFIDPDRINQVLLNLYLNAIDAMEKGGSLSVKLSFDTESERIKISVSDTGTGIDKKDIEKIFDPYYTKKPSGTGLGMAIVHRIVEAHKGDVSVESVPGKGTTVFVSLPSGGNTIL